MTDSHSDMGTVLQKDETALVIDAEGNVRMLLPEFNPEDEVPEIILALTMVMIKFHDDPDWVKELADELKPSIPKRKGSG